MLFHVFESFTFFDEVDYKNEIFPIPSSARVGTNVIWRENAVAVVSLLRVLARLS